MIKPIFHDGKKSCVGDKKFRDCSNPHCFVRKDTVLLSHDLTFMLIKSKKNYKAKFSNNLLLKKF